MPPIVLIFVGTALLCRGIYRVAAFRAARRWASAPGEILSARIAERYSQSENGPYTTYCPEIFYGYRVGGVELAGHRQAFGDTTTSSRSDAESTIARYSPGTIITVYFDPADPTDSVLERDRAPFASILVGVAGCVCIAIGTMQWLA